MFESIQNLPEHTRHTKQTLIKKNDIYLDTNLNASDFLETIILLD